jgi:hypothetical protein
MAPEKKRKGDSSAGALKRQRSGSGASTSKVVVTVTVPPEPTVELPFGVNPSPNVETLSQPLCGFPFHLWVNLRAAALFAQVDCVCCLS